MNDEDDWKEPYEDTGITLGPEEILRREIEKSKNLKVERLQLKDEIEKLRTENAHLTQKNQALTEEIRTAQIDSRKATAHPQLSTGPSPGWSPFLIIFTSCALAIVLYFLLQK